MVAHFAGPRRLDPGGRADRRISANLTAGPKGSRFGTRLHGLPAIRRNPCSGAALYACRKRASSFSNPFGGQDRRIRDRAHGRVNKASRWQHSRKQ